MLRCCWRCTCPRAMVSTNDNKTKEEEEEKKRRREAKEEQKRMNKIEYLM